MVHRVNGYSIHLDCYNYGTVHKNGKTIFTGTYRECVEYAETH